MAVCYNRRMVAVCRLLFAAALAAVAAAVLSPPFAGAQSETIYRKILCPPCDEDALRAQGAQVLVRDADYLVLILPRGARLEGYELLPVNEADLIRRTLVVTIDKRADIRFIASLGVDILEAGGDYLLLRAFDGQVDKIEEAGFAVEFIPRP